MKKLQWITRLSLATVLLVSCTTNNKNTQVPKLEPPMKSVPVATNPQIPAPVKVVPKGLIVSPSPTTIAIAKGRRDPFSAVPVAPIKQPVPAETTKQVQPKPTQPDATQPNKTKPDKTKTQTQSPSNQKATPPDQRRSTGAEKNATSQPNTPSRNDSDNTLRRNPPPAPTPSTDLARAVQVKGVIKIGEKLSAIVKEPNETTSRYVSAGEYLSNGAVLVKRIKSGINEEPVVILEQNGVEVIKAVSSTNGPVASIR